MFCLDERNIRVAISAFCNLNCIYCDGAQSRRPGRPGAMEDFRRKPLDQGVVSADVFIKIIEALHLAGFSGVALTGGEPLLNREWDVIVNKSKEIGMSRVGVTTNGTLLNLYLQKNKRLPQGLTLLTISLDTVNADMFKAITRGGNFEEMMKGLSAAKKDSPRLKIRANKVLLKSGMESLPEYIRFCEKSGIIDEINLLNLVLKEPKKSKSRKFFEEEFVSASEAMNFLSARAGYSFFMDSKYEFETELPNGLRIILKDTNLTMRDSQCDKCQIYCQEGFYTVRVATDGAIAACIDYKAELPFIDGPLELKNGMLISKVKNLVQKFEKMELKETLDEFLRRYNISSLI